MNGRVYDYNLGRFMSVDPFVHEGSQGLNPYSYIMNNPLSGTDPTGYEPEKETVDVDENTQYVKDADGNVYIDQGDSLVKVEQISATTGNKTATASIDGGDVTSLVTSNGNTSSFTDASGTFSFAGDIMSQVNTGQSQDSNGSTTGSISPIEGSATKGFLKSLVNMVTMGIVYGDISSESWLNADPIDRADMEAYRSQAGLSQYAIAALPSNTPKGIIRLMDPRALISRQGRNEMTGSNIKRIRKNIRKNGYDQDKPV